jgi:hypothetical protein
LPDGHFANAHRILSGTVSASFNADRLVNNNHHHHNHLDTTTDPAASIIARRHRRVYPFASSTVSTVAWHCCYCFLEETLDSLQRKLLLFYREYSTRGGRGVAARTGVCRVIIVIIIRIIVLVVFLLGFNHHRLFFEIERAFGYIGGGIQNGYMFVVHFWIPRLSSTPGPSYRHTRLTLVAGKPPKSTVGVDSFRSAPCLDGDSIQLLNRNSFFVVGSI